MRNDHAHHTNLSDDIPRRLRLSSREIGVAVALTCAAALQLIMALTGKSEKTNASDQNLEPAAFIQHPR